MGEPEGPRDQLIATEGWFVGQALDLRFDHWAFERLVAARITAIICYRPGCWIPVTDCEIDHLIPWGDHGETNQDNAGPGCGCHNRLRNLGYRAERLDDGSIAVYDPDGNRIL
ncbi:MAG: HNH endonuclease signature motif containing protein [Acidimicrobiales bacterium]